MMPWAGGVYEPSTIGAGPVVLAPQDGGGPARGSGEALETLSRELGVTAATLAQWRDQFLAGGQAAVRSRPADERDGELARLRVKVGELTMENALLRERAERAEAGHPFASRRSRR